MISPKPTTISPRLERQARDLVAEPNEARHRLAALQLTVAPSSDNLRVLERALQLETRERGGRPRRVHDLGECIRELETKLSTNPKK